MQQSVLESGGVSQLVSLTQSMDPVLRLNSVWALRNLLFMADTATKRRVMREVGYPTLAQLVQDPEDDVQEQALMLFRNLVHGKVRRLGLSLGVWEYLLRFGSVAWYHASRLVRWFYNWELLSLPAGCPVCLRTL